MLFRLSCCVSGWHVIGMEDTRTALIWIIDVEVNWPDQAIVSVAVSGYF